MTLHETMIMQCHNFMLFFTIIGRLEGFPASPGGSESSAQPHAASRRPFRSFCSKNYIQFCERDGNLSVIDNYVAQVPI